MRVKHGYAFPGEGFSNDPAWSTLVTPGNFAIGGGFKATKPKTFSGEYPDEYVLAPGDLIVTMTDLSKEGATLGLPATIPSDAVYLHNQRIGLVEVVDSSVVNLAFLHYYLRSDGYRAHILGTATGSTVRHTSPSKICAYRADLPCLEQQRSITTVLGALDDKIAANTNLVSTADAWVRAIFTDIAREAQGKIVLARLATLARDLVPPSLLSADTMYVGLEHIPRRLMWLNNCGAAMSVTSTKSRFQTGDILFGKLRPYFHKVVSAPAGGVCSTDVLVVRPVDKRAAGFVLAAMASDEVVQSCTAASEGTRMPRASWKDLAAVEVPWPGDAAAAALSEKVSRLRDAVEAHLRENDTLAAMRDLLLPALMSGAIRVKDAEMTVEEVL